MGMFYDGEVEDSAPRKLVKDKGPRIDTTVFKPLFTTEKDYTPCYTVPTVEAELADLATRQLRRLPSGGSMEIAFLEEDGLHTFVITKVEVKQ